MDKLFEIRAEEIDINQILQKINDNIQKRYSGNPVDLVKQTENLKIVEESSSSDSPEPIDDDIKYLLENYAIQNNGYNISSHRPFIGPMLIKGRQLVNGETRLYVDPVIGKQSIFNNHLSNVINFEHEKIKKIDTEINKLKISQVETFNNTGMEIDAINKQQFEMASRIEQIDIEVFNMRKEIRKEVFEQFKTIMNGMDSEIKNNAWLLSSLEDKAGKTPASSSVTGNVDGINYFVFSEEMGRAWNKIGGEPVDRPNIFEDVVTLFGNCSNVIDIGCGKGYLLQRLNASSIHCYGIDINEDYLQYCKRLGLEVVDTDALSHLRSLEDKSVDGIYIGQMIEHLSTNEIIELLRLCYQKLQYGSYLVMTMPNITSMIVSTNLFFMDPTHKSHVHPEVIKFLLKSAGFRDIEERLYQRVTEEKLLKKIGPVNSMQTNRHIEVDILNENFEKLNNIIFGYRDYAVFSKK